jgi:hypothetical protein
MKKSMLIKRMLMTRSEFEGLIEKLDSDRFVLVWLTQKERESFQGK